MENVNAAAIVVTCLVGVVIILFVIFRNRKDQKELSADTVKDETEENPNG